VHLGEAAPIRREPGERRRLRIHEPASAHAAGAPDMA
jgi:hypothetical protein